MTFVASASLKACSLVKSFRPSFFPIVVLPLPSLPWQEAQFWTHSAAASAPNAVPEEAMMIARITEVVSFIRLGSFRLDYLSHEQVELVRVQTGFAIMFPRQLEKSESVLVCSESTIRRLVEIDEAAFHD